MEGQVFTREFQNNMKLADVPPIFKKETIKKERQLRPVRSLSHMLKVSERFIYKQIV